MEKSCRKAHSFTELLSVFSVLSLVSFEQLSSKANALTDECFRTTFSGMEGFGVGASNVESVCLSVWSNVEYVELGRVSTLRDWTLNSITADPEKAVSAAGLQALNGNFSPKALSIASAA